MNINIYEPFTNPVTKETFRAISHDENAYVMQWTVQPKGYVPFEHIHLYQDEHFHVKKGEVRLVINGKEHIGKAGDTIIVPAGAAHIAYNNSNEVMDSVVEFRPGLDMDIFWKCYIGLITDGHMDKKGGFSIPKIGYFAVKGKVKCLGRPTNIPGPILNAAFRFFYLIGAVNGWKKLYTRYTGLR